MILLDTNVISESMRIAPDRRVMSWLDRHPASSLFLCAITVDEIAFGIEVLPSGRKRTRLAAVFSRITDSVLGANHRVRHQGGDREPRSSVDSGALPVRP